MAAEIQALVLGFDYAYLVKDLLHEILGTKIKFEAMIDIKTGFNFVAKEEKTSERRLQIDIFVLRQSYDLGELDRVAWISSSSNPGLPHKTSTKIHVTIIFHHGKQLVHHKNHEDGRSHTKGKVRGVDGNTSIYDLVREEENEEDDINGIAQEDKNDDINGGAQVEGW